MLQLLPFRIIIPSSWFQVGTKTGTRTTQWIPRNTLSTNTRNATTTTTEVSSAKALYRNLLRLHAKHLPTDMRSLGDAYVKTEFRLHNSKYKDNALKPLQIQQFLQEWQQYHDQMMEAALDKSMNHTAQASKHDHVDENRNGDNFKKFGKDLAPNMELTAEQKLQLEKLREEASLQKRGE